MKLRARQKLPMEWKHFLIIKTTLFFLSCFNILKKKWLFLRDTMYKFQYVFFKWWNPNYENFSSWDNGIHANLFKESQ